MPAVPVPLAPLPPAMPRCALTAVLLAAIGSLAAIASAEPAPFMMRARVNGRLIEGQPLAWNSHQILLMGRDGALYDFKPSDAQDSKKTAKSFVGYTSAEMQALISAEFGRRFEISHAAHFVVAHPRSRGGDWADRLETLYRGFSHYMSVRGFNVRTPTAPLVAIVFPNRDEYYQHAASAGNPLPPGTLGHYDAQSNRIYLFDIGTDDPSADWSSNAETIIHEATHQTAYNVGVHARFAEQPRWLVEGLAMMFEAPGVWNAASLHTQAERINPYRLNYFRTAAGKRPANWIGQLVASDRPYETAALDAYAAGWALTFYLCETRPQEYSAYLARVAMRKPFTKYTPAERVADFTRIFGGDFEQLAAQVGQFIETLP
jgi:hypothetical protein